MKHFNNYFLLIEEKCEFPKEAREELEALSKRLDDEPEFGKEIDRLRSLFMFPRAHNLGHYIKALNEVALKYGADEYTLNLVFLMCCTELLNKRYRAAGVSDEVFWGSIKDYKYKLLECMECKGVVGTFVPGWYEGFFEVDRFFLGRFQFEARTFPMDFTTSAGIKIKKGEKAVNIHIPSSGVPLTDEVRFDAYKKAYEFFPECRVNGNMYFICNSWLLFPRHKEFLPKHLNILKFLNDFEIFECREKAGFGDDWRVFGHYTSLPVSEWPEDTALRKAYKTRLLEGKRTGSGHGVIVFDGEKIVR